MVAVLLTLLLGCGGGAAAPDPTVPLQIPCDRGTCAVDGAVMVEGAEVAVTRRLDLDGRGWPGALVEVVDRGEPRTSRSLVVVSLRDDPPKQLLWLPLNRREPDGSGLSTLGEPRWVRTHADQPLTVQVEQTSLPAEGEEPYRPGPPLREEWRWDGAGYVRFEGWSPELATP